MSNRLPNPRLVKIHRNYVVEEIAALFKRHKNSVRQWIKNGLKVCDEKRPMLILGPDLVEYLESKRRRNRRPCGPDQIYCMRCREPRRPAANKVEYKATTATRGNLVGACSQCGAKLNRATSLVKLVEIQRHLDVSISKALQHIDECTHVSVNSDFNRETSGHE